MHCRAQLALPLPLAKRHSLQHPNMQCRQQGIQDKTPYLHYYIYFKIAENLNFIILKIPIFYHLLDHNLAQLTACPQSQYATPSSNSPHRHLYLLTLPHPKCVSGCSSEKSCAVSTRAKKLMTSMSTYSVFLSTILVLSSSNILSFLADKLSLGNKNTTDKWNSSDRWQCNSNNNKWPCSSNRCRSRGGNSRSCKSRQEERRAAHLMGAGTIRWRGMGWHMRERGSKR